MKGIRPLRILFVEDNPRDAELAEAALAREGLSFTARRVDTQDSLLQTLTEFQPDLIISDYAMPDFDGMQALAVSLAHDPNIPFIILTGSMNEETAVACLRGGVWDYVLKENLSRLAHAVREALAHRDARVARAEAEEALRKTERRLSALIENGLDSISLLARDGTLLWESPAVVRNLDYAENEFIGRNIFELMHPDDSAWVQPRFEKLLQSPGFRDTGEFRLRRRNGEWRWIEAVVTNLLDDPSVGAVVINYRDVTERREVEARVREERDFSNAVLNSLPGVLYCYDQSLKFRSWNKNFERVTGYTEAEIAGMKPLDFFVGADRELVECRIREVFEKGWSEVEADLVAKDGTRKPYYFTGLRAEIEGRPHLVGVGIDLSARRRAEAGLKESEARLGLALDAAHMGTFDWDIPNDRITWSRWHEELWGFAPGEFEGTYESFSERIHPDDLPLINAEVQRCIASREPYAREYRVIWPDGSLHWIQGRGEFTFDENGRPLRMRGVVMETTERKQAEEALRESEHHLSEAQRMARLGRWTVDVLTWKVTWSEELYDVYGRSLDSFAATFDDFVNILNPEDQDSMREWARACVSGESPAPLVFRTITPAGDIRHILGQGRLVRDARNVPVRMVGTAQDITDRKQAENQVRLSRDTLLAELQVLAGIIRSEAFSGSDTEQTIRSLLEADARQQLVERVSLWLFVQEGTAIRCFDLYELPQDRHTSGMGIEKQDYPAYFDALLSEEAIVADDAHSHSATRDFSASYLTPLGISSMLDVPIHIHGKLAGVLCHERVGSPVVWSPEQRLFAISIANLVSLALEQGERNRVEEERNKLQDQLLQVQKMDAIGRLAGGVAHDFNNMLQAILGHVDIALRADLPESSLKGDLLAIRQAAMHSADLTRQLLAFARKQTIDPKVLDLNETVSSMLRMLQRLIGENIQLIWTPGYRLWRVRIDPTQVNQILANLTVNARDAISGVGRLTIETSNATLDEAYCEEHVGFVPGEYVRLSVSDNGRGMSKETVEQIFEPFFTTKGIGEGTGLGLATVYGIVKQNEGFIQVQSEIGKGTTFQIFFPRCGSDLADQTPEVETEMPRGGTETILLVEDEPAILLIGRRILEELGYTVLAASGPAEAIRLASEHPGGIHLLITDVIMPEMDGRELGNRLHAVRPSMKLLFMSGYTANIIAHRGILEAGIRFIQKPFNITDLGKKVREALDS